MIGNNSINLSKNKNFAARQNNTSDNADAAPAFKGCFPSSLTKLGKNHLDFCGIEMPFIALPFFTFGIVLTSRILKARDEVEKREVFTRDAVTISTILFGVPVLNKLFAKFSRSALNVPISLKPDVEAKNLSQRILSPVKKMWNENLASFDRLKHWYQYDGSTSADKDRFLNNLINIGKKGDDNSLGKLFRFASRFDKDLKKKLLQTFHTDNIAELKGKNNASMKTAFQSNQELFNHLANKENGLLKSARFIKSIPGVANIAIIASMLGIFIPWFNTQTTKKIMAARLRDSDSKNTINTSNNQASHNLNAPVDPVKLNKSQQTLFKSFIK